MSQAIREIDTLRVKDLERSTADGLGNGLGNGNAPREQQVRAVQRASDDIDRFIQNAKLIQASINEAMAYDGDLNRDAKENL